MNLILLNLDNKKRNYGSTNNNAAIQPNIYMGMLESYMIKKGHKVRMLHQEAQKLSQKKIIAYIQFFKAKEVWIIASGSNPSASTMSMIGIKEFVDKLRGRYKGKIKLYGGHPTVLPERSKRETGVDNVIIGQCFKGTPTVNWDNINPHYYKAHNWHTWGFNDRFPYAVVYTSLGCPYKCSFCCVNNLFGKPTYIKRPMKEVIKEIDFLVKHYQVKHIKIMDELFISKDHKRINEFCDLLEKRNYDLNMWCFARVDTVNKRILKRLKKVGMNWIAYGFESVNQRVLDKNKKKSDIGIYNKVIRWTKEAGLNIIADVIVGFWEDNYNSMNLLYNFLVKHNFEFVNLYPLFSFPGTKGYTNFDLGCDEWEDYSLFGKTCNPEHTFYLEPGHVLKWRDTAFINYISRPEYLKMIDEKFGSRAMREIIQMAKTKLKRDIYDS